MSDGRTMAGYLQGALLASVGNALGALTQPTSIRQTFDADGYYVPFFLVTLASGIVLRVTVSVESEPSP